MADSPAEAPTELLEESESKDSFDQILKKVVRGDAPVRELTPGTLLSERFRIAHILGAGGMGSVYLARDESLGRDVAIKLHHAPGGSFRLKREAIAMARLAHPNVVTVFEVGELDRFPFVVMEYVPGTTLRAWLAEEKRTVAEILDMMLAAGAGLAAAHDAGLIHRDIKPENVLIGRDGRARVGDFGLARELDSKDDPPADSISGHMAPMTQTGAVLGTPAYMAPEQLRGETIDARIDQFAYCVTVWEALWGQRPFAGKTLPELEEAARMNKLREPPPLPKVSARVRAALERGLAAKPDARFPSMRELLAALRAVRRRRAQFAILGGLALAAAGTTAFVATRGGDSGPECSDEARLIAHVPLDVPAKLRAMGQPAAATRVEAVLQHFAGSVRATSQTACQQLSVGSPRLYTAAISCLEIAARTSSAVLSFEPLTAADVPTLVRRAVYSLPSTVACASPTFLASSPALPSDPLQLAALVEARSDLELAVIELNDIRPDRAKRYLDRIARSSMRDSPLVKPALLVAQSQAALVENRAEDAARLASDGYYAARALDDDTTTTSALQVLLAIATDQAVESTTGPGWLRTAVADAERIAPRAAWLSANLYLDAARVAVATDDPKSALAYLARVRELAHPSQEAMLAATWAVEGDVRMWTGKVAEGKVLYERAIAAKIAFGGPDDPSVGLILADYARALLDANLGAEALAVARRAVKVFEPTVAATDHASDTARLNLAAVLSNMGEAVEARKLLEITRSHYTGPPLRRTTILASVDMNLAVLHLDAQETGRAIELLDEALAINTALIGPERDETADILYNLAVAHRQAKDFPKALDAAERTAKIRGAVRPGAARHRYALAMVAAIANDARDHVRALSATETVLAFPPDLEDGQSTAWPQLERGRALLALRRDAEARPLLASSRAIYAGLGMDARVAEIDRLLSKSR